jgi:hypothetical protein
LLALTIVAGASAIVTPAKAQNYPWCANFADGAGTNCGFSTLEQCMATSIGSGGSCTQNDLYRPPAAAATVQHRTLKHRPRKNS